MNTNTVAQMISSVRVYVHPGDEITANALIGALKKEFPGVEFDIVQREDEEYSCSSPTANKAVVGIPASCRFTPANTCRGCGEPIEYATRHSHSEKGCANASQTAKPLADRLAELRKLRRQALQEATLADAAIALCVARDRIQVKYGHQLPPFRERVGVEYSFINAIPFLDSSSGTLNTGNGIRVRQVDTIAEANCLCIVQGGKVVGWVTPAREWSASYAVGYGHYNSRSVEVISANDTVPNGTVVELRFLGRWDTGIVE